jgi:hypothetical protein
MLDVAGAFAWLTPAQRSDEVVALANDVLAQRSVGVGEVDLLCRINADRSFDSAAARLKVASGNAARPGHAAALACMGDREAHPRVLAALASAQPDDARIAQAYIRHRPIDDAQELRPIARAVVQMPASPAKVRALDALARLRISDRQVLDDLTHLYSDARNPSVQNAVAEIFLRSGHKAPGLAAFLREHRLAPAGKGELVDVLIARLGEG